MILLRPVNRGYAISQHFGENLPFYPQTHGHNGLAYACPEDTPVIAAADGILVKTGQLVLMGEVVGRSGNTGRSSDLHLNFERRTSDGYIKFDPSWEKIEAA